MRAVAQELRSEIDAAAVRLGELTEAEAVRERGAGKWILKEILGHLIDSATNNHQRFVRAQLADPLVFPAYSQDAWVGLQRYRDESWGELLQLWLALNKHVAHVIESVPEPKLQTRCIIGESEPVTLEWLMRDYLRHLRHHLGQILS